MSPGLRTSPNILDALRNGPRSGELFSSIGVGTVTIKTFFDLISSKELEKVMKNINRFNKRYATGPDALFPELFISKATVSRSIKTQKRMRKDAIYGVKYGKAYEKYIEQNLEVDRLYEDKKREDAREDRRQKAID